MADAKITALNANTDPQGSDLLVMVDDPLVTPVTKKITFDNMFGAWGLIAPTTPPDIADFTWVNQGGASTNSGAWGIYMYEPASGGDNNRVLKMALPAAPYTLTAAFNTIQYEYNYHNAGICLRESGSGKLVTLTISSVATVTDIINTKFNSPSSWSGVYKQYRPSPAANLWWLQIEDDNTNRITRYSTDGINYEQVHSVGRTDFITPDEAGICLNVNNVTLPSAATFVHWSFT